MKALAGRTQKQLAQFLSRHRVIPSLLFFCSWRNDVTAELWMWHIHTHTHIPIQSPGSVMAGKPTLITGVAIAAVTMSCTPRDSLQSVTPYFCCTAVYVRRHCWMFFFFSFFFLINVHSVSWFFFGGGVMYIRFFSKMCSINLSFH